ncbi:MAG: aspartate aminotransferase family protein [Alcanivorax sp.]|uniref:aspartate aminotransferase family protein n=1 Tax=Alcanivorax sp. TaxID=1872427 RepID=UPI001990D778|nr:aspartate aminotransferase family protein [Alcanivorax sp.]MBD3643253.1 aspartate aminotransferase family protein [Alcanivorax sp.]MDF1723710.1 aspartate aminotransferase family protein [Alcanivorax sp.]
MSQYLIPTYARQPLAFVRGEGVWLYDEAGHKYMDAISGIGVCNLGHCHPAVTRTLADQAGQLMHTSNLYRIPSQEALAQRLCEVSGMQSVFFSNSGAEANEAAIKIARLFGQRKGVSRPTVVVMEGSFHGRTMATLSATANTKVQEGFAPLLDGFIRVPFNDLDAVRALRDNPDVVAVLVEPIQGEGGINIPASDYLPGLRALCDEQDWLLMLDEIQSGNGRTGDYFACLGDQVTPDVLTTAKGLGNGFPIGACLVAGKADGVFGPGNHGSTYGGNPLGCATALTVVNTLTDDVVDGVADKGTWLKGAFAQALTDLPMVSEIRQRGLMLGIQLDRPCAELVNRAREAGLLINVTAGSVVRLLPPLVISQTEMQHLVDTLSQVIHDFANAQEVA